MRFNVLVYDYGVMGVHMMYCLGYLHSDTKRLINRELQVYNNDDNLHDGRIIILWAVDQVSLGNCLLTG